MKHPEYIGYFGDYQYTEAADDEDMGPGYRYPVRTCAAKCTRWWRMMFEDDRGGLCWQCYVTLFEGEEDMTL